jgi:hypothetical protein
VLAECQSVLMVTRIGASMCLNSRWGPSVQSGAVVWSRSRILIYTPGCVWCDSWGAHSFDGNIATGNGHGQTVDIAASEINCETEYCLSWCGFCQFVTTIFSFCPYKETLQCVFTVLHSSSVCVLQTYLYLVPFFCIHLFIFLVFNYYKKY